MRLINLWAILESFTPDNGLNNTSENNSIDSFFNIELIIQSLNDFLCIGPHPKKFVLQINAFEFTSCNFNSPSNLLFA